MSVKRYLVAFVVVSLLLCKKSNAQQVSIYVAQAHYADTTFRNASFTNFSFRRGASFRSVHFDSLTTITDDSFYRVSDFQFSKFKGYVNFGGTLFHDTTYFTTTQFDRVDFGSAMFKGMALFDNAEFGKEAQFIFCVFEKTAQFNYSKFHNKINFKNASFKQLTSFNGTKFDSTTDFSNATFKGKLILTNIVTTDASYFNFHMANLPEMIDLSNNPILRQEIDLTTANFEKIGRSDTLNKNVFSKTWGYLADLLTSYFAPHAVERNLLGFVHINLYNTDISKIKIDYEHFRLDFSPTIHVYPKILLKPVLDKDKIASVYETLLKNFKDRGMAESAKNLTIEYEYKKSGNKYEVYIRDWWDRFGYEKDRIFKHTFLFLFIFTIISYFILPFLHEHIYAHNALNTKARQFRRVEGSQAAVREKPVFENDYRAFLPRLWFSLVYTSLIFFPLSLKIDNLKFSLGTRNILGTIYVILVYTTGLICIAYMANFILQK